MDKLGFRFLRKWEKENTYVLIFNEASTDINNDNLTYNERRI